MRQEKDSLGIIDVPKDALYGAQTVRANHNFNPTGQHVHIEMVKSLAAVKKACALANKDVESLTEKECDLIVQASNEILEGNFEDQFITDAIQGGAGTSLNMNVNEVISNRAAQIENKQLGKYEIIHPNDHVNKSQSTNDVIPTAGKLTILKLSENLISVMETLKESYLSKAKEYDLAIKVGRTHLQDAVLISFGQIFNAHATLIERDINRIKSATEELYSVNLGGTAVGTGINTKAGYREKAVAYLAEDTGYKFVPASDMVDSTRHIDTFANYSSALKNAAMSLSRVANDYRMMASGPRTGLAEISIPEKQPGSSIMPGKVNPVILELCNQVAFDVMGNDLTVTLAAEAGQMELNVFEPVLFKNIFDSIEMLTRTYQKLNDEVIVGLSVNEEKCNEYVVNSFASATPLINEFGYDKATEFLKEAVKRDMSIREVVLEKGIIDEQELDQIIDPVKMIGK